MSNIKLDSIMDIPMTISVEVGNTKAPIRSVMSLSQGSIIELDKLAGEPLDLKINGKVFARGEVVVVNNKFGIRVVELFDIKDGLKDFFSHKYT